MNKENIISTKRLGLTLDELDIFKDSVNSDVYSVFIKICEKICGDLQKSVISFNLTKLNEETLSELAYLKMRVQGAEKLILELKALKDAIKEKQK